MLRSLLFLCSVAVPCFANVNVGAYYYPWHAGDFHRDGGYLREEIGHTPVLGEYDDRNPDIIRQHLSWSQQANIGVWVTSWWGPRSREDNTIRHSILPTLAQEGTEHKIALHYESANRLRTGVETLSTERVLNDIQHICDHYVNHPNYLRIDGRPVLVLYLTRSLFQKGVLEETLLLMRTAGAKRGYNLYLVGDHAFGIPPTDESRAFDYLDAITTYDVYGQLGTDYAGQQKVDRFSDRQAEWKSVAKSQDCAFIPSVTPGFNDRAVRLHVDHPVLSRKLHPDADFGTLFHALLTRAVDQIDEETGGLLFVNSFNEWHEDTQIEPVVGPLADTPFNYTQGFQYEGYGERYLDILREVTCAVSECDTLPPPSSPTNAPETSPTTAAPSSDGPSSSPTSSFPTQMPSPSAVIDPCDDDPRQTFMTPSDGEQKCIWLAARPQKQQVLCVSGHPAYDVCEETCGKCFDDCEDEPKGSFFHNGIQRDCLWLSLRLNVQQVVCTEGHDAWDVCQETCGNCEGASVGFSVPTPFTTPTSAPNLAPVGPTNKPSMLSPTFELSAKPSAFGELSFSTLTDGPCDDDPDLTFPTTDHGDQKCVWLSARPSQQEILCNPSHAAFDICKETCGKCSDACEDTGGSFEYKGKIRDCLWLSLRTNVQAKVCKDSHEAWSVCPETCNNCS